MPNTPVYSIRLDPALKLRAMQAARRDGLTLAELITKLLREYLDAQA